MGAILVAPRVSTVIFDVTVLKFYDWFVLPLETKAARKSRLEKMKDTPANFLPPKMTATFTRYRTLNILCSETNTTVCDCML